MNVTIGRFKKRENLRLAAWNFFFKKKFLKRLIEKKGHFFQYFEKKMGKSSF